MLHTSCHGHSIHHSRPRAIVACQQLNGSSVPSSCVRHIGHATFLPWLCVIHRTTQDRWKMWPHGSRLGTFDFALQQRAN